MKEKNKPLSILAWVLLAALILVVVLGIRYHTATPQVEISDGIQEIDLNTIYLPDSKIEVKFSDVILSDVKESRKLIVATQDATVSTVLTDQLIKKLDFDFMKKTQTVTYTGEGYFIVDLEKLEKSDITQDEKKKTVTIKINHATLETITIDPNKVIIAEVKESLLAKGDIELTVADYNKIEKELLVKLDRAFNTPQNIQNADVEALKAVKKIYEPIIKAIDSRYEVIVEFK